MAANGCQQLKHLVQTRCQRRAVDTTTPRLLLQVGALPAVGAGTLQDAGHLRRKPSVGPRHPAMSYQEASLPPPPSTAPLTDAVHDQVQDGRLVGFNMPALVCGNPGCVTLEDECSCGMYYSMCNLLLTTRNECGTPLTGAAAE
jgi:hypothetical protein